MTKLRSYLAVAAIAAVVGSGVQIFTPTALTAAVEEGYPGTLYKEVIEEEDAGDGGYLCSCRPKNCTPCQ